MVWLAAHWYDWGGYPKWAQKDVEHAFRSAQVAEEYLTKKSYPEDLPRRVTDCIRLHHGGESNRSLESILLSGADALDFLGVGGVLRDFSKNTQDLRRAYETSMKRREKLPGMICLSRSKAIATQRIKQMEDLLGAFEQDSFGCF